jgi:flavin-dependent dehydrogenase
LVSSIQLARAGVPTVVIEKKSYPFHRVCGEYISNEVAPFLTSLEIYPKQFAPPQIKRFQLSTTTGKSSLLPLDLGGFGISRYAFDHFLFEKARDLGVTFMLNTEVEGIEYVNDQFIIRMRDQNMSADAVIGSFGKRSKIDVQLGRSFIRKRSPYVGVKYHITCDHPADLIGLHNFAGGYCGISNVENGKTNLCYLTHRDNIRRYGSIDDMQEQILFKNPLLKSIFTESDFLFEKPEVINEISFETKSPVEDHILMAGDSAGMITPLCGNGMSMAIRSAKLAADLLVKFCSEPNFTRNDLEQGYAREWKKLFAARLWRGRQVQRLFGRQIASNIALNLVIYSRPIAGAIIRGTHGDVF